MRFLPFLLALVLGLSSAGRPNRLAAAGSAGRLMPGAPRVGQLTVSTGGRTSTAAEAGGHGVGTYRPPIPGPVRVLRGFSPPANPYGPGHLGVDLSLGSGAEVLAAGSGIVRFAGQVAGRGVVVIRHPDGISSEYEPVRALVRSGNSVAAGQPIGRLVGTHRGCPAPACLHWGARRGGQYLDPMSLLRPLGVVRLLPWDGLPDG